MSADRAIRELSRLFSRLLAVAAVAAAPAVLATPMFAVPGTTLTADGRFAPATTGRIGSPPDRADFDRADLAGVIELLVGKLIAAGAGAIGSPSKVVLDFLLQVASFDGAVGNFGSKAGVIYSSAQFGIPASVLYGGAGGYRAAPAPNTAASTGR